MPILTPGGAIIWVAGYRIDDRFKVSAKSRQVLTLRMRRIANEDGG